MSVIITNKDFDATEAWETDWYICPKCNDATIPVYANYCPFCGERLIWNIDNDK